MTWRNVACSRGLRLTFTTGLGCRLEAKGLTKARNNDKCGKDERTGRAERTQAESYEPTVDGADPHELLPLTMRSEDCITILDCCAGFVKFCDNFVQLCSRRGPGFQIVNSVQNSVDKS